MSHPQPLEQPATVHLLLLGVAQDAGLPQAGCSCPNCRASWAGELPRQFAVCAAAVDAASRSCWLVDCTPDFRDQYNLLLEWLTSRGLADCRLQGVLLTHLHWGHYAGLAQFGREAMDWRGLKVYGSASVLKFFMRNQPWHQYCAAGNLVLMPPLVPGQPLQLSEGLTVTPAAVPHRAEFSDACGYFIQGPRKRAFFLPDIDSWDEWESAGVDVREVVSSVDVAFLDACFYSASELPGRDMSQVPHPLVLDTLERLAGLPHGRVVLVHLNHTNLLWRLGSDERAAVEAAGVSVGEQGASHAL